MRSQWKVNKKYFRSFKNIKKTNFLKRGDIIPSVSSFGKKVSVYTGRNFISLHIQQKMIGLPVRSYVPSTAYGSKVQQKWLEKKEKQKTLVKKK